MESPTCADTAVSVDIGREMSCPSPCGSLRPLFHFLADDTVVIAMEYNDHSKLLALSTSRNEIFVTRVQSMPTEVTPASGGVKGCCEFVSATTLVDRLRYPCTQLIWAPWQYGSRLACVSRGKNVRMYRLSHNRWELDESVHVQDCNAAAFSSHLTMACACAKGKILIFAQSDSDGSSAWSFCATYSLESECSGSCSQSITRNRAIKGCTCVSWDETGSLLAIGDSAGSFRVVYISGEGRRVSGVAYGPRSITDRGAIRHLSWAPGAGRSFLILSVVAFEGVTLLFFKRPSGGSAVTSGTHVFTAERLQVVTEATLDKLEVVELVWNSNGTRFVVSRATGAMGVWTVGVSYLRPARRAVSDMVDGGVELPHAGEPDVDDSPVLVASVRKLSAVHPFHSGGHW